MGRARLNAYGAVQRLGFLEKCRGMRTTCGRRVGVCSATASSLGRRARGQSWRGMSHRRDRGRGLTALSYALCSTAMGYGGQKHKTADTVPAGRISGLVRHRVVAWSERQSVGGGHSARTTHRVMRCGSDRVRRCACRHSQRDRCPAVGFPSRVMPMAGRGSSGGTWTPRSPSSACPAESRVFTASAPWCQMYRGAIPRCRGRSRTPCVAFLTRQKKQAYRRNAR